MTRTQKTGIDYFPISVDFFDNPKICAVTVEHGIKGQAAVMMILCAIYRNGYYIEWTPEVYITILKELPGINIKKMQKIVGTLVEWGFFDQSLFEQHQVLTSRDIQQYFSKAADLEHKTANGSLPYWLVKENDNEDGNADSCEDVSKEECNDNTTKNMYENYIRHDLKPIIGKIVEDRQWTKDTCALNGFDEAELKAWLNDFIIYLEKQGKREQYGIDKMRDSFETWHTTGKVP